MSGSTSPVTRRGVITAYVYARRRVIEAGFLPELQWQQSRGSVAPTESDFLREFAWVVLAAGMRERVIRLKFSRISEAFLQFESAEAIAQSRCKCRTDALEVFGHKGKINAIVDAAVRVYREGFSTTLASLNSSDLAYLQTFDFIGPATSCHLAKNLGLEIVKPDRHLVRLTAACGYDCPTNLCRDIAEFVGERLSVVDLVLWRYATLSKTYLDELSAHLLA